MSVVGFGEVPEIKRKSYVVANLHIAITHCRDLYSLHGKVLVHKNVAFFKTGAPKYRRVKRNNQVLLTVFTSPAVKASSSCDYVQEMRRRISTLVTEVERSGVNAMVFGAWGCGSVGLNPHMVATLFKEALKCSPIPTLLFVCCYCL